MKSRTEQLKILDTKKKIPVHGCVDRKLNHKYESRKKEESGDLVYLYLHRIYMYLHKSLSFLNDLI